MAHLNPSLDPADVAAAEAAQQAAEASAAAQRQAYAERTAAGVIGVSSPDADPEYRRTVRDA